MTDPDGARYTHGHEQVERMAAAWRRWGDDPDAWFVIPNGELLVQVTA